MNTAGLLLFSLSLTLISCGAQQRVIRGEVKAQNTYHQRAAAVILDDRAFDCDPQRLKTLKSSLSSPTVFTNATRLSQLAARRPKTVNIWLDWLEAQGGEIALLMSTGSEADGLETHRDALRQTLLRLGRSDRKPPLRAQLTHSSLKKTTLYDPSWLHIQDDQLFSHLHRQETSVAESERTSEKTSEDKRIETNRCDRLILDYQQQERSAAVTPIRELYEQTVNAGVRLLRAPRAPISAACLKLFALDPMTSSESDPDPTRPVTRWHLVLKRLAPNPGDNSPSPRYLTLPLPHVGEGIPRWGLKEGTLEQLWSKRALWWGARGCWQEVSLNQVQPPLGHYSGHWRHHLSYKGRRTSSRAPYTKLFQTTVQEWLAPTSDIGLISRERAALSEDERGLSLALRGVLETATPPHHLLKHRLSSARLAALWSGDREGHSPFPSAYFGVLLLPYLSYEALLQLSDDRGLFELAYQRRSLAPLVFVPQNPQDHRLMGKRGEELRERLADHLDQLQRGDIFTAEETPVDAWRRLGTPSLFEDAKSILKERLSLFLRDQSPHEGQRLIIPGEVITSRLGPWLGEQRLKTTLPPTLLP